MLYLGTECVYAGASINIQARVRTHRHRHKCDRVEFVPCERAELKQREQEHIDALKPRLNAARRSSYPARKRTREELDLFYEDQRKLAYAERLLKWARDAGISQDQLLIGLEYIKAHNLQLIKLPRRGRGGPIPQAFVSVPTQECAA